MRLVIFSMLLSILAISAVNANPSKPSVADQIRHPGQRVAYGNCQTTCQWLAGQQICNTHCF
jgi:hypothetical protein